MTDELSKRKIYLAMLIMGLVIFLSWIFLEKSNKIITESNNNAAGKVDLKKMEEDYKAGAKMVLADYSENVKNNNLSAEKISEYKNKLLGLKVPAQFKDLHLNLVLAFSKDEDYLKNKNEKSRVESQQMINEVKANYVWLN